MAPTAYITPTQDEDASLKEIRKLARNVGTGDLRSTAVGGFANSLAEHLPENTKVRFDKYGIDYSKGYPERPPTENIPIFLDEVKKLRSEPQHFVDRGLNADPQKKALFGAAKEVRHLTKHIGTEIVGLQLADLNDKQKDELALLIAERVVVFFKDQDLSPQKQYELGEYWGNVEKHAQQAHVPGIWGETVIWIKYFESITKSYSFRRSNGHATANWHTDLTHEVQPPGITHLHLDLIPDTDGDTVWASGYAAYDKLSPALQEFLEDKKGIYISANTYIDRENPLKGKVNIEREHPIIRTHPVTGWRSLFVNRSMTRRIVGLEPEESKLILEHLFGIFEKNLDIQVRFQWQSKNPKPGYGTSALWDNRISEHYAVPVDPNLNRHGTRVSSLAEVPYFDPASKSQREALGLPLN